MKYSRIVLVEPKAAGYHVYSRLRLPRLGLPILGAVLQKTGREVGVYCQDIREIDHSELLSADLVGISTTTSTAPEAYRIAQKARKQGIPTVIGGVHATFMPDEALRHADYCLRGEAEESFPLLIEALEAGGGVESVPGLSFRRGEETVHNPDADRIKDLDSLPFPDLSLVRGYDKAALSPVLTSRGCPYSCNFCTVTSVFGRRYRFRSPENVVEELQSSKPSQVFFYDDNFTADPRRTKQLLELMLRKGITPGWTAQARVDAARDKELLRLMKRSNCFYVYLGLESVNPETLKEYDKKQTVEQIVEGVRRFHEHNILVHGMFVFGAAHDDAQTIRDTVRFALRNKIDTVQFMTLTPLPGTAYFGNLEAQDRLLTRDWSLYDGQHVVYSPEKMTPFELQKETFRAMKRFYGLLECAKMVAGVDVLSFAVKFNVNLLLGRWQNAKRHFWSRFLKGFYRLYGHILIRRFESANREFMRQIRQDWAQLAQRMRDGYSGERGAGRRIV